MAFLAKVNDLREARRVSEDDLFVSAIDLFSGPALQWYRNIKKDVRTWSELVYALKRDFLPVDYEDDLMSEIRARTQGPQEPLLSYIISMKTLFGRLTSPPTEAQILKQIRRNLNPYFVEKLCLTEITSLRDLKDKCRTIQEVKVRNERYLPPPSKKHSLLEPDLACLSLKDEKPFKSVTFCIPPSNATSPTICWNCRLSGHSFRDCASPKTIFCYGCGTKGIYRNSCSKCGPKNESSGAVFPVNTGASPTGATPKTIQAPSPVTTPISAASSNQSRQTPRRVATYVPHLSMPKRDTPKKE